MKLWIVISILGAAFVHGAALLFGGIFFLHGERDAKASLASVDLLSAVEEEKKEERKSEEKQDEPREQLETPAEQPPDGADVLRDLEAPSLDDGPALEAASLEAIEAALDGGGASGEFAQALTFASGGKIGANGKGVASDEKLEQAFSLAELDQKPRAILQDSPAFPSQMRGKKVEGMVTLIFVVDAAGKVESPRVEKSSHSAFEAPAVAALRKWKFEPGVRAGQRVATKMRVSIRFPQA